MDTEYKGVLHIVELPGCICFKDTMYLYYQYGMRLQRTPTLKTLVLNPVGSDAVQNVLAQILSYQGLGKAKYIVIMSASSLHTTYDAGMASSST